jgi:hypothetical protein
MPTTEIGECRGCRPEGQRRCNRQQRGARVGKKVLSRLTADALRPFRALQDSYSKVNCKTQASNWQSARMPFEIALSFESNVYVYVHYKAVFAWL